MSKYTSIRLFQLILAVLLVFQWPVNVTANPSLLGDIGTRFERNGSHPSDIFEFNGVVFFEAENQQAKRVMWASDGSPSWQVEKVWQINITVHNAPIFITLGNAMYFRADDGVSGIELWKYDGTSVSLVADINPGSEVVAQLI